MPYRFETLQIHAGQDVDPTTKARAVPIYQTTAYAFDHADHAVRLFALREFGNIYSRIMNPTNDVLEKRIAALEGGAAALAVASGHAAEFLTLTTLAEAGDNIVASPNLYGGTANMFTVTLPRLGVEVRFVGADDRPEDYAARIDARTKAVYLESIPNPSLALPDIKTVAAAAHAQGVAVVVDNTAGMGGYLYRPIEDGADLVLHSATKWINGHGTGIGGLIVDAGAFDWSAGRYPRFTEATASYGGLRYAEAFGPLAFIVRARVEGLRDQGPALSPHNAFGFLQGLETLSLRAERHVENTEKLAVWLERQAGVVSVNYPGLPEHPYHAYVKAHFPRGVGSVLTFEIEGGRAAGQRFLDSVQLASRLVNLGDAKTSVTHPASTTHAQLAPEALAAAGVSAGMIRVAVGLEHIADIEEDFVGALSAAQEVAA